MTIISRRSSRHRMSGILTGIAVAFDLLVAALPATAGAAQLNYKEKALPKGNNVTLKSVNPVMEFNSIIIVRCASLEFHGVVTVNSSGEVVVAPNEEASIISGCATNGQSLEMTPGIKGMKLSGSTGTASFILAGWWSFASTSTVSWVGPNAKSVHIAGALTGTSAGTFRADFTLSLKDGTPLTIT
jgi:hypothetical protein